MAGTNALDHFELAQELLDACESALDTLPALGLDGIPDRSFVSPGEPAADCCPQLTVHGVSLTEAATEPTGQGGLATGRRASYSRLNHVALIVTLFRCVPVPDTGLATFRPPEVTALEEAARQIYADGWAIWNHTFNLIRAGLLFSLCREVFTDGGRMLPQQGGCGGWVFQWRVALDGYEEALP